MLITLESDGKVHLDLAVESGEPYIKARASWIREDATLVQGNIFVMNRLLKALGQWLTMHVSEEGARTGDLCKISKPPSKE